MTKMRRKLDGYFTGEKKAPNRRVKFCPLSPCKMSKTPIFQLDKHLQSGIHNQTKVLSICQGISASPTSVTLKGEFVLKKAKKQRARTNEQATCDEADNSNEQNMKCDPEDNDMYSDQDYEELGRRAQGKIRSREEKTREKKRSKEDCDEEYDRLAHKAWKKNEVEKTRARGKKQNARTSDSTSDDLVDSDKEYRKLVIEGLNAECKGDIMESNHKESFDNDTEDKWEEEIYSEEENANTRNKNEDFECVEISDSEESRKLDPDYLCSEESDPDTSTQSITSISSSSLSQECQGLLTELIEVIGEDKINEGSFLDNDEDWRETVKQFKSRRIAQGHTFKSELESAEELARVNEDSMYEAFHEALDGDESDNDEALDTNWVLEALT